ncbi:MAG: sensor histidine kinase [Deltaproteobacteria bacterium]|nr:sensor histidine kinase [Deltaproteobacteria bacterium]
MEGVASRHRWRLWPRYQPGSVEIGGGGPRLLLNMGGALALCAAVLSLPPVHRATGLSPARVVMVLGAYFLAMVFNDLVMHPAALRSRRGFDAQIATLFLYNEFFCLLVVVLPNQPWSPLWLAPALWAFKTGSWQEIDSSLFGLACHLLGPLLTIPVFVSRGVPLAHAVVGPLLASVVCGLAYAMLGATSAAWRDVRDAQKAELERHRARAEFHERERVARDLHDSVGSTLALTASYATIIRRYADDPDAMRKIAATLEEMGREGLADLRAILDALAPDDATVDALPRTIEHIAEQCEIGADVRVEVRVTGDRSRRLSGSQHLAVARVAQEALRNAIQHGGARRISCELDADAAGALTVLDDGAGLDASRDVGGGRGVASMRRRAEELGGRFELASGDHGGVRVRWSVPWSSP